MIERVVGVGLLISSLAACAFDGSALSARVACGTDLDCATGVCVSGYCYDGLIEVDASDTAGDTGAAGDTADTAGDTGADTGTTADTGDTADTTGDTAGDTAGDTGTVDRCRPGEQGCEGDRVWACNPAGEREVVEDCADIDGRCELRATGPACVGDVCLPGSLRCGASGGVERCDAAGSGYEPATPCPGGTVCDAGTCRVLDCEPGATRCASDVALGVCGAAGTEVVQPCVEGRFCLDEAGSARCAPRVCEPGARRCVAGAAVGDEGVERCLPSGGGWEEVEACGPGRFCDAGRCLATVCEPGGDFCADALTLATCDARGTRATGAACEPGTFCELVDGEALCTVRECLPGTRRCAGDRQPEACAADGASWSAVAACEGALVCVDGLCGAPVCGDGIVSADNGESCDDANALGCDGCETCGLRSVAVLAPGVVTRSGPPVDVGERDLTIEAWVNVTGDGLLAGLGRGDASDNVRLLVRGGVPVFAYALGSGRSVEVTSAIALTPGWHHVAGVRFGRTNAAIWVDGAFAGYALTGVDRTSIDDSPTAWIGSDGVGAPAAGLIDEVRFSLAAVYTAPFAPARRLEVTGSTVALYHLDEASGATALDATTARRDLALVAGRLPDDCYAGGAPVVCGDGTRAALEGCDDGNLTGGDGCSASCQLESACDGVTGIRGECYRVLGNADWPGAQAQCAAWGGQLVTINDAIEAAWLRTALVGGDNEFWIGLNDRATEGSFGWVSGSSAAYRQWASGEPNNYFFREDCVVMNPGNGGSWNDTVCGDDHPGICER